MATLLRFDNATLGTNTVAAAEFVSGSGRITLSGDDGRVTTGDGRIHNFRRTITPRAECELYGDKTSLESAVGLGVECTFKRGTNAVYTAFTGTVAVQYNKNSETSRITVTGTPSLT